MEVDADSILVEVKEVSSRSSRRRRSSTARFLTFSTFDHIDEASIIERSWCPDELSAWVHTDLTISSSP